VGALALEAIRRLWQQAETTIRPGATEEAIAEFERLHGNRLPRAARDFYQLMDGMEFGSTDEELIYFWPLAEIGSVPEVLADFRGVPDYGGIESNLPDAESQFVFADWSIWCCVYAIRLSSDPEAAHPVLRIESGSRWSELAGSFEEFLGRYATSPRSILA
jgi:hypothetical protein